MSVCGGGGGAVAELHFNWNLIVRTTNAEGKVQTPRCNNLRWLECLISS